MASQSWKNLERDVAKALQGKRISRGDDFSRKDVDVEVEDFPTLKVDAKYRARWGHHKFLAEVVGKYCEEGDIPVLVTKHHRQQGAVVAVTLEHFGLLLDVIRELRDELEATKGEG